MKKTKVLVINICLRPYMRHFMFPLGIAYIMSAIRGAGFEFQFLDLDRDRKTDEEIQKFLNEAQFDVVAFGCIVTGYKIVKKLARMIRTANPKAVIVAGNSVADSIPKTLLEKTEVDVAVIGEGDITIVDVLNHLEEGRMLWDVPGIWYKQKGEIHENPRREVIKDVNSLPYPDWESFDIEAYIESCKSQVNEPPPLPLDQIRPFVINTARGCPFRCTFCYQVFQKYGYRHRSIDSIIAEIKELQKRYGINYFISNDELSFPTREQVEKFVDRILEEKLKIFWTAACRSDLFNSEADIPLLKKIKESGCIGFGYSLESANLEILKFMNKHLVKENFIKQTKLLNSVGIETWTSLVFGYPQETKETIKETMDLCYDLDIYPSSGYLLPQPNTPMYQYILDKGLVKDEEEYLMSLGDRQDLRINLTQMSDEELQTEVKNHLRRIADKLRLGLSEEKLLKTTTYQSKSAPKV